MSGELISTSLPNRGDIWTAACDDNSSLVAFSQAWDAVLLTLGSLRTVGLHHKRRCDLHEDALA